MSYDVAIRNGTLVDGSGAPPRRADVGVSEGRVVAVGELEGGAKRTLDADGCFVTPGFVDIHTHLDAQICWDPIASSPCWHGVTSVVMGNCGMTFAPSSTPAKGMVCAPAWFGRAEARSPTTNVAIKSRLRLGICSPRGCTA